MLFKSLIRVRKTPDATLADIGGCCYDPRSGGNDRLIPALGDRLMVGLQTLTLPV